MRPTGVCCTLLDQRPQVAGGRQGGDSCYRHVGRVARRKDAGPQRGIAALRVAPHHRHVAKANAMELPRRTQSKPMRDKVARIGNLLLAARPRALPSKPMDAPHPDTTDYAELIEFLATGGRVLEPRQWSRGDTPPGTPSWIARAQAHAQSVIEQAADDAPASDPAAAQHPTTAEQRLRAALISAQVLVRHRPARGASSVLFDGGRLRANVDFARGGYEATVASYRRVVLVACRKRRTASRLGGAGAGRRAVAVRSRCGTPRAVHGDRSLRGRDDLLDFTLRETDMSSSRRRPLHIGLQRSSASSNSGWRRRNDL